MKISAHLRCGVATVAVLAAMAAAPVLAEDAPDAANCPAVIISESPTPLLDAWEKTGRQSDPLCITDAAEALRNEGETSAEAYARLVDLFAMLTVRAAGVDRSCSIDHSEYAPERFVTLLRASRKGLFLEERAHRDDYAAAMKVVLDRPGVMDDLPIAEGCATQAELLEEEPDYAGVRALIESIARLIPAGIGVGILEASSAPDADGMVITYAMAHQMNAPRWETQGLTLAANGVRHFVALPLEADDEGTWPQRLNLYLTPEGDYGFIRGGAEVFTVSRTTYTLTQGAGLKPEVWQYTGAFDFRRDRTPSQKGLFGDWSYFPAAELPECLGELPQGAVALFRSGARKDCLPGLLAVQTAARKIWLDEVNAGREAPQFVTDGRVRIAPLLSYGQPLDPGAVQVSPFGDRILAGMSDPILGPGEFLIDPSDNHTLAILQTEFGDDNPYFSLDGRLIREWADGMFVRYETATGDILSARRLPSRLRYDQVSDDGRLILSEADGRLRGVNSETGAELYAIADVNLTVASYDGRRLVVRGETGSFRLHDAATGTLIADLPGAKGYPRTTSDSARVYFHDEGKLQVFDLTSGALLWRADADRVDVLKGSRQFVVVPAQGQTPQVHDAATGAVLHRFDREFVVLPEDGAVLAGVLPSGEMAIWDAQTFALRHVVASPAGDNREVIENWSAVSPDGRWIVRSVFAPKRLDVELLSPDGTPPAPRVPYMGPGAWIGIWDTATGELVWRRAATWDEDVDTMENVYRETIFSRDSRRLIFLQGTGAWIVELPQVQ